MEWLLTSTADHCRPNPHIADLPEQAARLPYARRVQDLAHRRPVLLVAAMAGLNNFMINTLRHYRALERI